MAVSLALARMGLVSAPFKSRAGLDALPNPALVLSDRTMLLADGRLSTEVTDDWYGGSPGDGALPRLVLADDAAARIILSSGTTGSPKTIVHSNRTVAAHAAGVEFIFDSVGGVRRLQSLMGLTSAWAYFAALAALKRGVAVLFASGAEQTLRMIATYGCDYVSGSANQMRELVEEQRRQYVAVPSLRAAGTGGSLVPQELVREMQATLSPRVLLFYGSSEAGLSGLEVVNAQGWQDGSGGYVTPWTELEVVDDAHRPLPRGADGEIRLRTPGLAAAATEAAADGGLPWFYPGDRGTLQADGRIVISGRTTDMINIGGSKLSCEVIEQYLLRHPMVLDAGVIGITAASGFQAIRAAVVSVRTPEQ